MSRPPVTRSLLPALALVFGLGTGPAQAIPFLGEIQAFAFNFCPRDWVPADGTILPVSQYPALFSLYGTRFGGNGSTNFGLPDLRGRSMVGASSSPNFGLTRYQIGQTAGQETVTLTVGQMPNHTHTVNATGALGDQVAPNGHVLAYAQDNGQDVFLYHDGPSDATMDAETIGQGGMNQPHENRPPYLAVNYCVATQGIYPARP